ncbi:MAG: resA [Verrucomicrobiales bacterium]|nr:resA [Verrucomicrobiales bacterium]
MKFNFLLCGPILASLVTIPAFGARLGDPAPAVNLNQWIKGQPVDVNDGKNIYVVEFWATWCGPCKMSIPKLTEGQKAFKDKGVVFIGVSAEDCAVVKPFVDRMGDQMGYTVGCDNDNKKTYTSYMDGYSQNGIPHAFIVQKGKVIWHGNPLGEPVDKALDEILAGKYDLAAAKAKDEPRALLQDYQTLAANNDPKAKDLGKQMLKAVPNNVDSLLNFAFNLVANPPGPIQDFETPLEALDRAEKLAGKKDHRILMVRSIALFEQGKSEDGKALMKQAIELVKGTPQEAMLNRNLQVMEAKAAQRQKQQEAKPKP